MSAEPTPAQPTSRPDQRTQPDTVELAAALDEAIDLGDQELVEQLGQQLYQASDGNAGAASAD